MPLFEGFAPGCHAHGREPPAAARRPTHRRHACWRWSALFAACVTACTLPARAQGDAGGDFWPHVKLSGYGTIGAVRSSTDAAEFANFFQTRGATTRPSLEPDSRVALQGDLTAGRNLSATLQVQAGADAERRWEPSLQLAFVKARLSPIYSARVGRMPIPFFVISDFRNVGYANLWVRPPGEVYGQVPLLSYDGGELQIQDDSGAFGLTTQLYGGRSRADIRGSRLELHNLVGVNATAQSGSLSLRLGHARSRATMRLPLVDDLVIGLRSIAAVPLPAFSGVGAQADAIEIENKPITFSGIGAAYEDARFVLLAELTRRRIDGWLPATKAWYATAGIRVREWTPYVTVARLRQSSAHRSGVVPSVASLGDAASSLPPALVGSLPALGAGLNTVLAPVGQESVGFGARWDAARNIAVKMQFERIQADDLNAPTGLFTRPKPGAGAQTVGVISVAVDFVF